MCREAKKNSNNAKGSSVVCVSKIGSVVKKSPQETLQDEL